MIHTREDIKAFCATATTTSVTATTPRARVERDASVSRGGWVHLCNGLDPVRDGGMVPSILGMTGALAALGPRPGHDRHADPLATGRRAESARGVALRGPDADLEAAVRAAGEVVHLHGLWQGHTRRGARESRRTRTPYLVTAHGMADPWALRQKAWKKRIYTALVEGANLRRASCLHALARPEIGHLRALAPDTPICFVPNGVDLSPFEALPARAELEAEYPELADKFILLFYGRLHLKKGLDLLADALAAVAGEAPALHLLLAGVDDGALAPFRERIAAHGLSDRVTWVGHVAGERARQVWAAADAFVLPSYSEGFSMAVLEALACRLPAVITTACNFPELAAAGGGIVVDPNLHGVTDGLRDLLERSPADRRLLGRRGRELVERGYTWDQQARRLADVYRWLAGGGDAPEAVVS